MSLLKSLMISLMILTVLLGCQSLKGTGARLERPTLEYGWHCGYTAEIDEKERGICCMTHEDVMKLMQYILILEKR